MTVDLRFEPVEAVFRRHSSTSYGVDGRLLNRRKFPRPNLDKPLNYRPSFESPWKIVEL